MNQALKKSVLCVSHVVNGERVDGVPSGLRGYVIGLRGDIDDFCISDSKREDGIDVEKLIVRENCVSQ